jgi:V/A-type H+/Na+-transporting ATPase subunit C
VPQGYGYGNARVRAMRSRLLGPDDYDDLLGKATVEEVITRLAETLYKDDIEAALVRYDGARCVFQAVRTNKTHALLQLRQFYAGEPAALVDLLLRSWDRNNLLAVLRGVAQGVSSEDILSATVPVGKIDVVALRELARQPGTRGVVDLMTVWRLPYAGALSAARTRRGGLTDLDVLELALNRHHYATIREALAGGDGNRGLVLEQVQAEIDILNITTVLRLARLPEQVPLVRHRYGASDIRPLLIEPGGRLPVERLIGLSDEATGVEGVVRALSDTPYGHALDAGWKRYQAGEGGVPALERELERWQARERAAMFYRNPLTIAIPIGYLGYKEAEAENLRLIARGVELKVRPEFVRREMIIL